MLHSLLQHIIHLYLYVFVFVLICILICLYLCTLVFVFVYIYFKAEQTLNLLLQHLIHLTQSSNLEMQSKIAGWGISRIDDKKLVVKNLFVSKPMHFLFFSKKSPLYCCHKIWKYFLLDHTLGCTLECICLSQMSSEKWRVTCFNI